LYAIEGDVNDFFIIGKFEIAASLLTTYRLAVKLNIRSNRT